MLRLALCVGALAMVVEPLEAAAGGGFLPPLSIEVGAASISTPDGGHIAASQGLVGLSWASLYPKPTPIDLGVGVIWTAVPDPVESTVMRTIGPSERDPSADAVGGYLHMAVRVDSGRHWRTWAGMRGELMGQDGVGVLGGAARVSAELWTGIGVGGSGGAILGTVALTGWAELGARERPDRSIATIVAAGVGVRLPLVAVSH